MLNIGFGDHSCAADQSKCVVAKNRKSTLVIFKFQVDLPSFIDVLDPLAKIMSLLPCKMNRYMNLLFFAVVKNVCNDVWA